MRSSNSDTAPALRTTDLLVLAVLGDGPQHGYGLAQEIAARTKGQVVIRAADLYRVLYRMDKAGLIEPSPAARRNAADERRAYYRITPLAGASRAHRRRCWARSARPSSRGCR